MRELKHMGINDIIFDDQSPLKTYHCKYRDSVVSWIVKVDEFQTNLLSHWEMYEINDVGRKIKLKKYFHIGKLKDFETHQLFSNSDYFFRGIHIQSVAELIRYLKNKK
jgi:hypothetical protein